MSSQERTIIKTDVSTDPLAGGEGEAIPVFLFLVRKKQPPIFIGGRMVRFLLQWINPQR